MNKPLTDKELIEQYVLELSYEALKQTLIDSLNLLLQKEILGIRHKIEIFHINSGKDL